MGMTLATRSGKCVAKLEREHAAEGRPETACSFVMPRLVEQAELGADDVVDRDAREVAAVSMPTDRRTSSGVMPAGGLLLLAELRVGGGGGMDGQALGVAHVGEVREELELSMNFLPGRRAALDAEHHHGAALAAGTSGQARCGIALQPGVAHPLHLGGLEVVLATARAFSQWRSMRRGRVSMPCRNIQALSGEMQAPRLRSGTTRMRRA
jgi:hypothetical protein